MIHSFKTAVQVFDNQILVNIEISITKALHSVILDKSLTPQRANLSLKIPMWLKHIGLAYSKYRIRLSTDLSTNLANCLDLSQLELPIALGIAAILQKKQLNKQLPAGRVQMSGQITSSSLKPGTKLSQLLIGSYLQSLSPPPIGYPIKSLDPSAPSDTMQSLSKQAVASHHLKSPSSVLFMLLDKLKLNCLWFAPSRKVQQDFVSQLINDFPENYKDKVFIFDFYRYSKSIKPIICLLEQIADSKPKVFCFGIHCLSSPDLETLYQVAKKSKLNLSYFMQPCRCGNFLACLHRCSCHTLVRTRNLDGIPGSVLKAFPLAVSIYTSKYNPNLIVNNFLHNCTQDYLDFFLEFIRRPVTQKLIVPIWIQQLLRAKSLQLDLPPEYFCKLSELAAVYAMAKKPEPMSLMDFKDIFLFQANWYKYARSVEYI
jgi:hypothetical protein